MKELIDKIIKKSLIEGYDYFSQEKNNLLKFNTKEVLITFFNHPKMWHRDMEALLLWIPELWKDFNLDDWLEIIRNVDRPANYKILFTETSQFEDIKFLYKWIKIDSIKLYQEDSLLSSEKKEVLDNIIPRFMYENDISDLEMENFEDGTYGDYKYIETMRERLISQGAKPLKN
jgi:hypothetical protein